MISVIAAENTGFCAGVRAAVDKTMAELVSRTDQSDKNIYILGALIHNEPFNRFLIDSGAVILDEKLARELNLSTDEDEIIKKLASVVPEGAALVIRSHGAGRTLRQAAVRMPYKIIDATCRFVARIHSLTEQHTSDGSLLIIIGAPDHPEVIGTESYAAGDVIKVENSAELAELIQKRADEIHGRNGIVMVAQTTADVNEWKLSKKFLRNMYTNAKIFDTICVTTSIRQRQAQELAAECDFMAVIGSAASSNTQKLFSVAASHCPNTYAAETFNRLPLDVIKEISKKKGAVKVGVIAGASTPDDIIKEVIQKMSELNIMENETTAEAALTPDTEITGGELSFEQMLEDNLVYLNNGKRVKGVITSISAGELQVDLGAKHTGILPHEEITDDGSFILKDNFKIGDEIDVQIVKVSDLDGTAMLSKKRIDSVHNWQKIVELYESGEITEGKVVDVVNGGLLASIDSVRVFIPLSQSGIPRDGDVNSLTGKIVKLKIIDINPEKKRAVASIRVALSFERKQKEDAVWAEVEEGKMYEGTVRSIVPYGAFVDIGGVDGMIHVTELSWEHVKNPADVVKIGDKLNVRVKNFDLEKKRLSLTLKDPADDPWSKLLSAYNAGDVADVKINSLMPFGAFAEVIPGVDGLIHISQITDKKIGKPGDVLSVGEIVKAKITDIDEVNKKLSLSMRALIEDGAGDGGDDVLVYEDDAAQKNDEAVEIAETYETAEE